MSFWDNLLDTVTDFIQDATAAVTDFIQDTADAVTDFVESVGALTYGNYGGLNYSVWRRGWDDYGNLAPSR
jgi:hypothetical protein